MSDSLAERLKRRANEQANEQKAEEDVKAFQARVNGFISANATSEFTRLEDCLKSRSETVQVEGLPKYQYHQGSRWVQQDNCIAGFHFSKPHTNLPNNRLTVSIGVHPYAQYFDESDRPRPVRFDLQAAANDALDGIVWTGDSLGDVTTSELADIILENLTEYYLRHKPRA